MVDDSGGAGGLVANRKTTGVPAEEAPVVKERERTGSAVALYFQAMGKPKYSFGSGGWLAPATCLLA